MSTESEGRKLRRKCISAQPADRERHERLRAMVTTPEDYHDERLGIAADGQDSEAGASKAPLQAERLLLAERLAAAERADPDPADDYPEPSTLYDDSLEDDADADD